MNRKELKAAQRLTEQLEAAQRQREVETACKALGLDPAQRDHWVKNLIERMTGFGWQPFPVSFQDEGTQQFLDNALLSLFPKVDDLRHLVDKPASVLQTLMKTNIVHGQAADYFQKKIFDTPKEAGRARAAAEAVNKLEIKSISFEVLETIFDLRQTRERNGAFRTLAIGLIYELTNGFADIPLPAVTDAEQSPIENMICGFSKAQRALLAGVLEGIGSDDKNFVSALRSLVKMRERYTKSTHAAGD